MPFTAWKHEERNRHRDRQMYLQKFRGLRDYCANLHIGMQDGQRARTPDQTNKQPQA